MAFTNNEYSASMQDVFALRLEMMNQVKMLQEKIAEGGGGGTPYLATFTMTHITTPEEADILTADKTWKSVKEAVLEGKTAFYKIPNFSANYLDYDLISLYGGADSVDIYGTLDPLSITYDSDTHDLASMNFPPNAQIDTVLYEFGPYFGGDDTDPIQFYLVQK